MCSTSWFFLQRHKKHENYHAMTCLTVPKLSYFGEHSEVSQARSLHACWTKMLCHDRLETIECFHMTSRRPYWCPKTMKRRPSWCPKPVLWELNSSLMQTLSFVPINLYGRWPREWKHSIDNSQSTNSAKTKNLQRLLKFGRIEDNVTVFQWPWNSDSG